MGVYDVVNTEQAAAWDGHEGDVWTEQADRYDRAVRRVWERWLAARLVTTEDRVLDVGCGTGGPTRDAARMASGGAVTGIDLSTRMLDEARRRSAAEGLDNITFVQGDAQVFPFEDAAFDVAMSSFGGMFFNDPVAAFTNLGRSVRPGGTLTLMAWRDLEENDWLMALRNALAVGRDLPSPPPGAPSPFALADPQRVGDILGAAGFEDTELDPIDEPVDLGVDAADAMEFAKTMGVVEGLLDGLDHATQATAMSNLVDLFTARETTDGVLFPAAAWLITARKR